MSKTKIEQYTKLGKAADFYLKESFNYLEIALKKDFRQHVLSEKFKAFEYSDEDIKAIKELNGNQDVLSILQNGDKSIEALSKDTLKKILELHEETDKFVKNLKETKLNKEHSIESIELLGHLNNYSLFIEILTNRHLLFLKHTEKISPFVYNQLSMAKIMNRLIFICKDEIDTNKVQLNEIANLFKFRNKAVHYTPDNAIALQVKISALIRIWKQSVKLIRLFEKREKFRDTKFSNFIETDIDNFEFKWT